MKTITLAAAADPTAAPAFTDWILGEHVPRVMRDHRDIQSMAVSVVDRSLTGPPLKSVADAPANDVVIEAWYRASEREPAPGHDALKDRARSVQRYVVSESVEWVKAPPPDNGPSPGLKVIGCIRPLPGQAPADTFRFWDSHVEVARAVHPGVENYVRNKILARLDGGPDYFGFPMLTFASEKDLNERYFASPEARVRHAADIAQFVGGGERLVTREHRFTRRD